MFSTFFFNSHEETGNTGKGGICCSGISLFMEKIENTKACTIYVLFMKQLMKPFLHIKFAIKWNQEEN